MGRGAVLEEAINEVLPKAYDDAITENEVVAVGQPDVEVTEIADGEKFVFTAEVDVRPSLICRTTPGLRFPLTTRRSTTSRSTSN